MRREVIQKLEPYKAFSNVDEMLKAVNVHIKRHSLTKSALLVLRFIAGRAKCVPGAAWLKIETIAKSKLVSASERTVQRAIRKLEQLGILEVHKQMRETLGGQGANVYVIKPPASEDVTPDVGADLSGGGATETPEESSFPPVDQEVKKVPSKEVAKANICYIRTEDTTKSDKSEWQLTKEFTSHMVPVEFRDLVARYFNDAVVINRLWRKSVQVCRMYTTDIEVPVEIPLEAFRQTVTAYKEGRIKRTFEGYFWGTLVIMFVQHQRKKVKPFTNLFVTQTA